MPSLIFFACLLIIIFFCRCGDHDAEKISIIYSGKKAIAVSVAPGALIDAGADANKLQDSSYLNSRLFVRSEAASTNIIGNIVTNNEQVIFEPAIPFRAGKKFEWYFEERLAGTFIVPSPDSSAAAIVERMYPSADTVPENLLKIYFEFSAPMREGEALRHIHLLNASGDTVQDVFLDLQPELWNSDRTGLTIWLDPGRIKRDLIPNLEKGKALVAGQQYQLKVSDQWMDAGGSHLKTGFSRRLVVSSRDSITPALTRWQVKAPAAGSKTALVLLFDEPLDFYLLGETVTLRLIKGNANINAIDTIKANDNSGARINNNVNLIVGHIAVAPNEKGLSFIPDQPWKPGRYIIRVDAKLEDLAGNNLNRPFDNDALANTARINMFYQQEFEIRP